MSFSENKNYCDWFMVILTTTVPRLVQGLISMPFNSEIITVAIN